jgi:hypothetical protein
MTDHIEVLRRLIKCASGRADFTVSDAREADELLAAISAREGGEAVAWECWTYHGGWESCTKELHDLIAKTGRYTGCESGPVAKSRELFLHPAQPASQQGENPVRGKPELCGCGKPAEYMTSDGGRCCNKYDIKCQPAHPTGDRVRNPRLEYAVNFMDGWLQDETEEVRRNWKLVQAAALDQEKGNV